MKGHSSKEKKFGEHAKKPIRGGERRVEKKKKACVPPGLPKKLFPGRQVGGTQLQGNPNLKLGRKKKGDIPKSSGKTGLKIGSRFLAKPLSKNEHRRQGVAREGKRS